MTRSSLLTLLLVVTTACGGKAVGPAVPGAAEVQLSDSAPPAGYVELQRLSVQSGKGCGVLGSREDAETKLRGEAAKLGASYVRVTGVQAPRPNYQCVKHEYKLSGVAYRKPNSTHLRLRPRRLHHRPLPDRRLHAH